MIESVKNPRGIDLSSDLAVCSVCHRQAKGAKKIKNDFAYRTESDGSLTIQQYCRKCQRKMRSRVVRPNIRVSHKMHSCGVLFRTKMASQIYCDSCESSLTS